MPKRRIHNSQLLVETKRQFFNKQILAQEIYYSDIYDRIAKFSIETC